MSSIDWSDVTKKEARVTNDEDLGEVLTKHTGQRCPRHIKRKAMKLKKKMADYMDMMKEELFPRTIRQRMGNSLI
jgi:hypothetical protein